jgi:FdhD protein
LKGARYMESNPAQPVSPDAPSTTGTVTATVVRVRGGTVATMDDALAVERPLQIQARVGGALRAVSTTMRTPGDDRALAVGFLYAERVIRDVRQLRALESIAEDTVVVELDDAATAALDDAQRPFLTTGACGVCGRSTLDALMDVPTVLDGAGALISREVVQTLPAALRGAQATFARTGGLHAAGLFAGDGALLAIAEDVGRHNAVDKLVGARLLAGRLGEPERILVVSGRASFELAQKAAVAGFAVMIAVGAPSSLAVEVARRAGMTLVGFARADGFNVYAGAQRIEGI